MLVMLYKLIAEVTHHETSQAIEHYFLFATNIFL